MWAYANMIGVIFDCRSMFKVSSVGLRRWHQRERGNSLSTLASIAMKCALNVCIACSAWLRRWLLGGTSSYSMMLFLMHCLNTINASLFDHWLVCSYHGALCPVLHRFRKNVVCIKVYSHYYVAVALLGGVWESNGLIHVDRFIEIFRLDKDVILFSNLQWDKRVRFSLNFYLYLVVFFANVI
jgi:hypothetical protein